MADTPFTAWTVRCSGTVIQINFAQVTNPWWQWALLRVGKRFTTAASALDVEMSRYWFERSEHLGCRFTSNSLVFCLSFCGHWADDLNWPTALGVSMKKKKAEGQKEGQILSEQEVAANTALIIVSTPSTLLKGEPVWDGAKDLLSLDVPATQPEEDGGEGRKERPRGKRSEQEWDKNETLQQLSLWLSPWLMRLGQSSNCL